MESLEMTTYVEELFAPQTSRHFHKKENIEEEPDILIYVVVI